MRSFFIVVSLIVSVVIPLNASASSPKVVADIAPVHSLVSQVMEGVATPDLLIPAEASPHEYSFKPSEAKALAEAQVVFWIGGELTPGLEKSLKSLAANASKVALLEVGGTQTYAFREGATFEPHIHDDDHSAYHVNEHHDDHDGSKSDHDHHSGQKADEDHHPEHKDHLHHGDDPHAWLDPVNAKVWLREIAKVMSEVDPDNAGTYSTNADKASQHLDQLIAATQATVSGLGALNFVVFHDAYQYFERRFGVLASGAISLGDAADPSPARVREVQKKIRELGITCVFTEPQFNPGLLNAVFGNIDNIKTGVMDPLGAGIPTGPDHYQLLIGEMVKSMQRCAE